MTKGGLRTANTEGGGQKHAPPRDEETKGGLRTANTEGGGQKHEQTRDKETKQSLSTANTDGGGQKHALAEKDTKRGLRTGHQIQMGEDKTTHLLQMRRQRGG